MNPLPDGDWLNIGCGPNCPAGWVNIDGSLQAWFPARPWLSRLVTTLVKRQVGDWPRGIIYRNIRKGLGYAPETVAVVYSSHTLEHLYRWEALKVLQEVRRVLKPGGVCRVVVPDLAAIVEWYLDYRSVPAAQRKQASGDLLMGMLSLRSPSPANAGRLLGWYQLVTDFHPHKWMYDREGLLQLFQEAGFPNACSWEYLKSVIPESELRLVENSTRLLKGAGLCVEAVR